MEPSDGKEGSTVRVRQRALQGPCKSARFIAASLAELPTCARYGADYGGPRGSCRRARRAVTIYTERRRSYSSPVHGHGPCRYWRHSASVSERVTRPRAISSRRSTSSAHTCTYGVGSLRTPARSLPSGLKVVRFAPSVSFSNSTSPGQSQTRVLMLASTVVSARRVPSRLNAMSSMGAPAATVRTILPVAASHTSGPAPPSVRICVPSGLHAAATPGPGASFVRTSDRPLSTSQTRAPLLPNESRRFPSALHSTEYVAEPTRP